MATRRDLAFLEWLRDRGPDEWHRTAASWNWGAGHDVLHWIVTQPDCDKGTALDVFWKTAPEIALDETASHIPGWEEDNRLAMTIVDNWKRGFYRHGRFACPVDAFWYHHGDLEKYHRLRSIIPADMTASQDGQELSCDDYSEGFSPAAVAYLEARGISI